MQDTFKHQGLRKKLVDIISKKGIKQQNVLVAIGKIPRHLFMDNAFIGFAYEDNAFPIGAGQTISQPFTVAVQTELLDVKQHDKILEIGTGSGYQAAVLVAMEAIVYSIERQKELFQKTKDGRVAGFLRSAGLKVVEIHSDEIYHIGKETEIKIGPVSFYDSYLI